MTVGKLLWVTHSSVGRNFILVAPALDYLIAMDNLT